MNLTDLILESINDDPPTIIKILCSEYYQPYYYLIYKLTNVIKQGIFVELGVEKGRASASACAGSEKFEILGIDHTKQDTINQLEKYFNNFNFIEQDSLPVPEQIKSKKIDILHIDTEHSFSMAKSEFEAYNPYLKKGAIVLFDDLNAMDQDVLRYFASLPYLKILDDRLHPTCGYGVLVYG